MWRTSEGERKLEGAERRAFVLGLTHLLAEIDGIPEHEFKVELLNQVKDEDQRYVMLLATEQLLNDAPEVELTAWAEAVVGEVFETLKKVIEFEIQLKGSQQQAFVRRAVLDAILESFSEEDREPGDKPPKTNSRNEEAWEFEIECLADRILWDRDYDMYDTFVDLPPQKSEAIKEVMNIDDDYYVATPPVVTKETKGRLEALERRLSEEVEGWYQSYKKTGKLG